MLRFLSQLKGLPIVAQQAGASIGVIDDWVIDPDKGIVVAFRLRGRQRYVSTIDITTYLDDGLVVSSPDAAQPVDQLVRVQALAENPQKLLKLPVVSEAGNRLGKLHDAQIETTTHLITKIHVRPGWLNRLQFQELIIPRENIVRMTPKQAIVRYDMKAPAADIEPEIAR